MLVAASRKSRRLMSIKRARAHHAWDGAIDLVKERGVYKLYVQVAGGGGNMEQAVDVTPNEMEVEVERTRDQYPGGGARFSGGPSAGETVRPQRALPDGGVEAVALRPPTEKGVPSDGGEEAVAPRVPPVPSKPTQAEQDEHYATGHAACRPWCEHCVRGRGRVSPRGTAPEDELPEVGVDFFPTWVQRDHR